VADVVRTGDVGQRLVAGVAVRHSFAALVPPWEKDIAASGLDVPIQLTNFIDQIVTNPFGQRWFEKTVRGVAERCGLGDRIRSSTLSSTNFT
jgi:hypothetical protein